MRHDNGPCLHTRKLAGAEKQAAVSRHEKKKKIKKKRDRCRKKGGRVANRRTRVKYLRNPVTLYDALYERVSTFQTR